MDTWKNLTSTISDAAAAAAASAAPVGTRLSKQFGHLSQQARERLGAVDQADLTELPAEYRALEARVDGLRAAHATLARVIKVYETEGYDCPVNVQESVGEASRSLVSTIGGWTAQARGVPAPATFSDAPPPRTLAHTLSRAAASAAVDLGPKVPSEESQHESDGEKAPVLAAALRSVSVACNSVGAARLEQDHEICDGFATPWAAFGNQIGLAAKARAEVREARLALDSVKQTLKSAEAQGVQGEKVDQARAAVEHAEDVLVAATEEAIGLMKNALENPEPVRMLGALVKMCVFRLRSSCLRSRWCSATETDSHICSRQSGRQSTTANRPRPSTRPSPRSQLMPVGLRRHSVRAGCDVRLYARRRIMDLLFCFLMHVSPGTPFSHLFDISSIHSPGNRGAGRQQKTVRECGVRQSLGREMHDN